MVRLPIGQLGFSPEELQKNIRAFIDAMRKDMAQLSDRVSKDIHEVVRVATMFVPLLVADSDRS